MMRGGVSSPCDGASLFCSSWIRYGLGCINSRRCLALFFLFTVEVLLSVELTVGLPWLLAGAATGPVLSHLYTQCTCVTNSLQFVVC